jgi:hypothetical protein
MGKKQKNKRTKVTEKKKSRAIIFWVIGGIVVAAVVFFVVNSRFDGSSVEKEKKGKSFYVTGGETRPVLDPFLFKGMARRAYAAAKKYPAVMDQVHCYCYCDEAPFYHKSLLSCFTEKHGAG